jgi:hypothetical protein
MLGGRYNSLLRDEDASASGGSCRVTKFYKKNINMNFISIIYIKSNKSLITLNACLVRIKLL